ncbi:MAG TPA: GNAT family N-acetyltransferase [Micromonosporaceae bacterium]|jgi:mycothiol synthase
MDVRAATETESQAWSAEWLRRLHDWWSSVDGPPSLPDAQVEMYRTSFFSNPDHSVMTLISDGDIVGTLAFMQRDSTVILTDIAIAPEHRRRGHARAALRWITEWVREHGTELMLSADPADPASSALFAAVPLRAQRMMRALPTQFPLPDGVTGRTMTEVEFEAFIDSAIAGYADQMAESGLVAPADALRQASTQFAELVPDGLATTSQAFLTVLADDVPVGTNWLMHGQHPGLSFVYAVEVVEEHRGKGYGHAAMVIGERVSREAGDTHIALHVFAQNTTAIKLYERMSYVAVEHYRSVTF